MNKIAADLDIPGLSPRRLIPQDLELICRHRQAMFLDAGTEAGKPLYQRLGWAATSEMVNVLEGWASGSGSSNRPGQSCPGFRSCNR